MAHLIRTPERIPSVSRPSLADARRAIDDGLAAGPRADRTDLRRALRLLERAADPRVTGGELLGEIAAGEPRLAARVARWWAEAERLGRDAAALRHGLERRSPEKVRNDLADLARRTRKLQRDESDLIHEALHRDLGGSG